MDDRPRAEESPYQEAQDSTVDDWHGQEFAGDDQPAEGGREEIEKGLEPNGDGTLPVGG